MDFDTIFWGNPVSEWLISLALWGALWLGLGLARRSLTKIFESIQVRQSGAKNFLRIVIASLKSVRLWILCIWALTLALQRLELSDKAALWTSRIGVTFFLIQVGMVIDAIISEAYVKRLTDEHRTSVAFSLLGFMLRVVAWILVSLILLDNLGIEVTALVAGLGVGGIAIALAVQNILGDLFASLTIALDRPFEVGDFIEVENFKGTVERVGIKTTRLISLSGEELIFGNGDLLKSRVRNFRRMRERRSEMQLRIVYNTPDDKVRLVSEIVKRAIVAHSRLRFDYCRLKSLGLSSLEFEVVYWVLSPSFKEFMEFQEKINFEILAEFRREEIRFSLTPFTTSDGAK